VRTPSRVTPDGHAQAPFQGTGSPDAVLTARGPKLEPDQIAAVLSRSYGLGVKSMEPLRGERDQNIAVSASDGRRYVLKIANAEEPEQALECQSQALDHIAAVDPSLPVPRLVRTRDGQGILPIAHGDEVFRARLVTYLPGDPAIEHRGTPALRHALGTLAGRLDRALQTFEHPGADVAMIWDLCRASALRDHIRFIVDPAHQAIAGRVMDDFERTAAPAFASLRRQVIHNDLNQNNVVRAGDGAISGIIDFGDMTKTCLINEAAITIAHQSYGEADITAVGAEILAGYTAEFPLEPLETSVLFSLVKMRLLTREIIASWRAATNPGASPYNADISSLGWAALGRALELEADDVTRRWRMS